MVALLAVVPTYNESPIGGRIDHAEHGALRSCSIVGFAANGPVQIIAYTDSAPPRLP